MEYGLDVFKEKYWFSEKGNNVLFDHSRGSDFKMKLSGGAPAPAAAKRNLLVSFGDVVYAFGGEDESGG